MTAWPSTSMILLATSPCASRCTDSAASLLGRVDEAEHAFRVAVVPVAEVVHAVLRLDLDVEGVGLGELLGGDRRRRRDGP